MFHIITDFFYRCNQREDQGVRWFFNMQLPNDVRYCATAISIREDDFAEIKKLGGVVADIYYDSKPKKKRTFKGQFTIDWDAMTGWKKKNGIYISRGKNWLLVIPLVLWRCIKKGENAVPPHPTLF